MLVSILLLSGCVRTHSKDLKTVDVKGLKRTYFVRLPKGYDVNRTYNALIVLHGGGGSAENIEWMAGFSELQASDDFIIVYPNGYGRLSDKILTWNSGNCCGYSMANDIDDVGFIRELMREVRATYNVKERFYVTGISNGAMMSYRIGCELADDVKAIAPVAGALNVDCVPSREVSVIIIHGKKDMHVLYDGGAPNVRADPNPRVDKSVRYSLDFWSQKNKCENKSAWENESVTYETHTMCVGGSKVVAYGLKDAGHIWPGGKRPAILRSEPQSSFPASEAILDFFKSLD